MVFRFHVPCLLNRGPVFLLRRETPPYIYPHIPRFDTTKNKSKKKKKTDVIIFEAIDEKNMRLTKQHEVDKTYRQPIKLNKAINKHTYN